MKISTLAIAIAVCASLDAIAPSHTAHADAVAPGYRPRACPAGSWPGFPHGSGPCAMHSCTADAECFGTVCADSALCVDGTEVVSECGSDGACTRGTCSRARRCVPRGTAPVPTPSVGVGGSGSGGAAGSAAGSGGGTVPFACGCAVSAPVGRRWPISMCVAVCLASVLQLWRRRKTPRSGTGRVPGACEPARAA